MLDSRLLILSALLSFSALAVENKVIDIEGFRREFRPEKVQISSNDEAQVEASLLAEKIKVQVLKAYEAAAAGGDSSAAISEVRYAIEKDLELISPDLRDEVRELSLNALENAQLGMSNSGVRLDKLQLALVKGVTDRSAYVTIESDIPKSILDIFPTANGSKDAEKLEFDSKEEIINSLISDRNNVSWIFTANVSTKSGVYTISDSSLKLQLRAQFLGAEIAAGPVVSFKRDYHTNVIVTAEGLYPVLQPDGNFDPYKRDNSGNVIRKGATEVKRLMIFQCETNLDFETEYTGGGGFSIAGMGASTSMSQKFSDSVSLTSRRIKVPEYIAGKSATMKDLTDICHNYFLAAKISDKMTVKDSLNIMMKNVVSGLKFSHPKTKCVVDNQCFNWFNNELISLAKFKNYPRCVEESREKFMACELRGLEGQNCAVIDNQGKRISSGMYEYACDKGLTCVKYQDKGWLKGGKIFSFAKGICKPVNPKTYRSPLERRKYMRVNLI